MLSTSGDSLIRRIQINPFENSIELSPDNKLYKNFNITNYKNLNICGKVILISHKFE